MSEMKHPGFLIDINCQPAISKFQMENLMRKSEIRVLAASDSHRSTASILNLLCMVPETDLIIHLGDHADDYQELGIVLGKPLLAVKGNCDGYGDIYLPEVLQITLAGHSILMMHGHNRKINVKNGLDRLKNFAACQKPLPELVIFGHTHIYHDEITKTGSMEFRILNPGTCAGTGSSHSGALEIILKHTGVTVRRLLL